MLSFASLPCSPEALAARARARATKQHKVTATHPSTSRSHHYATCRSGLVTAACRHHAIPTTTAVSTSLQPTMRDDNEERSVKRRKLSAPRLSSEHGSIARSAAATAFVPLSTSNALAAPVASGVSAAARSLPSAASSAMQLAHQAATMENERRMKQRMQEEECEAEIAWEREHTRMQAEIAKRKAATVSTACTNPAPLHRSIPAATSAATVATNRTVANGAGSSARLDDVNHECNNKRMDEEENSGNGIESAMQPDNEPDERGLAKSETGTEIGDTNVTGQKMVRTLPPRHRHRPSSPSATISTPPSSRSSSRSEASSDSEPHPDASSSSDSDSASQSASASESVSNSGSDASAHGSDAGVAGMGAAPSRALRLSPPHLCRHGRRTSSSASLSSVASHSAAAASSDSPLVLPSSLGITASRAAAADPHSEEIRVSAADVEFAERLFSSPPSQTITTKEKRDKRVTTDSKIYDIAAQFIGSMDLSSSASPSSQHSLTALPFEWLHAICTFLPPTQVALLARTCKPMHTFCNHPLLWRRLCNTLAPYPCSHKFHDWKHLFIARHIKLHRRSILPPSIPLSSRLKEQAVICHCCTCMKGFPTEKDYHRHLAYRHGPQRFRGPNVARKDIVDSQGNVIDLKSVRDEKTGRYACPADGCDKDFKHAFELKFHYDGVHLQARAHPCQYDGCGKSFVSPSQLQLHIASKHTGAARPHPCPRQDLNCTKSFNTPSQLRRHMQSHLSKHERQMLACTMAGCNKQYANASALQKHHATEHDPSQLLYRCSDRSLLAIFVQPPQLDEISETCKFRYWGKADWISHLRSKHQIEVTKEGIAAVVKQMKDPKLKRMRQLNATQAIQPSSSPSPSPSPSSSPPAAAAASSSTFFSLPPVPPVFSSSIPTSHLASIGTNSTA